jgi:uncharacterized protein
MTDLTDRKQFMRFAVLFEGSLIAVAFALGWFADVNPVETIRWEWEAVAWGVAGALPLFLLFAVAHRFPIGPLIRIRRILFELLGRSLSSCRWYDLIVLAAMAGIGEEILFRGLFQMWFERAGPGMGLVGSNVLFGLAHLITPMYAVLAALAGGYLGVLFLLPEEGPNLLIPIITHGLYDYLAFLVVIRAYRREREAFEETDEMAGNAGMVDG